MSRVKQTSTGKIKESEITTISSSLNLHNNKSGDESGAYINFHEQRSNGKNFIKLKTPDLINSNYTLTLPAAIGSVDEVLKIDSVVGSKSICAWETDGGGVISYNNRDAMQNDISVTNKHLAITEGALFVKLTISPSSIAWYKVSTIDQ